MNKLDLTKPAAEKLWKDIFGRLMQIDESLSDEEVSSLALYALAHFDKQYSVRHWIIWSNEHNGWWKPNERGYTQDRASAGRYTLREALTILKGANIGDKDVPNEALVYVGL